MTPFKLSWLFFAVVAGTLVHVFSTLNSDIQNGSLWVYLIAFPQTFELHCNDTTQTPASFRHEMEKASVYHSIPLSHLTPLCAEMPSLNTDAIRGYVCNIIFSSLCQTHIIMQPCWRREFSLCVLSTATHSVEANHFHSSVIIFSFFSQVFFLIVTELWLCLFGSSWISITILTIFIANATLGEWRRDVSGRGCDLSLVSHLQTLKHTNAHKIQIQICAARLTPVSSNKKLKPFFPHEKCKA